jgi:threonine dehydrogenase-like Zn-dependent dehydrogenase
VRQLTYIEPGRLEWWDVDEPRIVGDSEALVRPVCVATCDLDAMLVRGSTPYEGPLAFGHECVAEVAEADGLDAGSLVSVPFQISCGDCEACRRGHTGNCRTVPRLSMYGFGSFGGDWGGFMSDLVRVPYADHMLVPLPKGVDPEAAASVSDNVTDAWRTVGPPLDDLPGAAVLVVGGAGSIGVYAAGMAVALGAETVDYLDQDEDRLEKARRLGANAIEGPYPERCGPYPITVDSSADTAGLGCAVRSTEPDGVCTSTGIYFQPETPMPLLDAYTKCVTFHTGRVHARPGIPQVLSLIASGRLRPDVVTDRTVGWDEAPDALAEHSSKLVLVR